MKSADSQLYACTLNSPVGLLTIVVSDEGLRAVLWPDDDPQRVRIVDAAQQPSHPTIEATVTELGEYFAGDRQTFTIALDPIGTEFQQSAWRSLRSIPYGTTVSYGEQAERMGDKRKARAVGAANGRNPISIVIPCHRVVGSGGALTGFAGGIESKEWLLNHERTVLGVQPVRLF